MWAVFWTVNNVAGLAGLLTSGRTALAADITSLIAELGAGVAAILLVLQITDNQEQARKLQAPQSSYDWAMAGIQGYSPPPDEPPASPALQAAPAPEIWTDAGA